MSWNALSVERVVELAQYWINQDWPLTPEKVPGAMAGIGWTRGKMTVGTLTSHWRNSTSR